MNNRQTRVTPTEKHEVLGHYIDGAAVPAGGRTADIYNPATGKVIKQVAMADADVVGQAVNAAVRAFPAWRQTPPLKRARIMFRFKELLDRHADAIVEIITMEHGKVLDDARGEFNRGVEIVEYACAAPELLKG
ncbi:MAG: aldehyde dehydrogenase family protein, partial [Gammaproteobacteria bacterium]